MTMTWVSTNLPDAPREQVARSTSGPGWFWVAYPRSSTRWGLQLIRADMSEAPTPDVSYESFDAAVEAAAAYDRIHS